MTGPAVLLSRDIWERTAWRNIAVLWSDLLPVPIDRFRVGFGRGNIHAGLEA
jgi:hypothetical protein